MGGPTASPQPAPAGARPAELDEHLGQLVVFFASHGGTGASTLAANAGVTLARMGHSVCVVDLDLQLGDALTVLGLEPKCPMSKLAREMESFDWEMLGTMLSRHASGLNVVSQVGCLEELNELTVARIPELLRYLQRHYEYVLIDGVRDFNDHALATMDVADQIIIVVTQDVPAVRGVSRRLTIFRRLGYPTSKIRVVANRFSRKNPITLRAITQAIGMEPMTTVVNDFATVHRAITEGVALYHAAPGAAVTEEVEQMTCAVFGLQPPAPAKGAVAQKQGLLSRMFSKKSKPQPAKKKKKK